MQAKKENDPEAIHACLAAEVKRQEGRFGQHSATLVKSMQDADKKRLEAANAAWRRFRDANCAFYADPRGIAPLRVTNADCTLNLTVNRVLELERLTTMFAQQEQAVRAFNQLGDFRQAGDATLPRLRTLDDLFSRFDELAAATSANAAQALPRLATRLDA